MSSWQKIKLFFSPIQSNPWGIFWVFVYSIFVAFFNIYIVIIIQHITKSIETQSTDLFLQRSIILGSLFFIHYLGKIFYKPRNFSLIRDLTQYLDAHYLKKFLQSDNNETEKIGTGRMIAIMEKGVYTWVDILLNIFWGNGIMLLTVTFSFFLIAKQSGWFFAISVLFLFSSIPWLIYFTKKSYIWRKKCKEIHVEKSRSTVRWIMSKFEIQQQDRYAYEVENRNKLRNLRYGFKFREKIIQAIGYDTVIVLFDYVFFGIVLYVGRGVLGGTHTFADFVLLTGLAFVLQRNIRQLQIDLRRFIDESVHVEKLMDTFDNIRPIKNYNNGKKFKYIKGHISLENITYGYGESNVFNDLSLHIIGGKKTALVGMSGGGKSTLLKLLAGYVSADQGSVYVDKQNISRIQLKSYYKHIGYLTQEPSVFDGTVYENLVYALDYIPDEEELHTAINNAGCEFIYDMQKGLQTEIGERGVRLSGGQKQRLAIAKIFLKNPEIILLDEPTSALDSVSEEKISQALHTLFQGRTVVVIAHRLQTVKEADTIVVIENGAVVESGTHTQLVKQKGSYAKMLDLQTTF